MMENVAGINSLQCYYNPGPVSNPTMNRRSHITDHTKGVGRDAKVIGNPVEGLQR